MKILITGGHFSPAYSLIKELKKRGDTVVVVGRRFPFEGDSSESYEYQVCKKEDIEFVEIKTGRYQRKFSAYTVSSLLKTPRGFLQARRILSKVKPDVVLTFGGYIGLPVAYAAKLSGIPVVLHEQTQNAGLASKFISKIASKICVSFRSSEGYFPKGKTVFTGNPLRNETFKIDERIELPKGDHKVIYITGGSTGSHFINSRIYELADSLLSDYILIHQTGDSEKFGDYDRLEKMRKGLSEEKKKRYILRKFIYPTEIGFVLDIADLLITRSGVNTIFEIMAKRKVSLLIPLPYGQNNEQLENAKLIKKLGIGDYINEDDSTNEALFLKIREMLKNLTLYKVNMEKTDEYVVSDAATVIADIVEDYGKKRS